MLPDAELDAVRSRAGNRTAARRATTPLAAALLGVVYPITPLLFHALAASTRRPLLHPLAMLAGTLLVLAIPAVGAVLIWRSAGLNDLRTLRARGVGMLLVISPALGVMIPTVASALGARTLAGSLVAWLGFWVLATAAVIWRSTIPRPVLSGAVRRRTRRVHRTFLVLLVAFVIGHLVVNLTALDGLALYDRTAAWFRLIWRTPITEPILIALLVSQLLSGMLLAGDVCAGRSDVEHLAQITAGLFLAAYLVSHTTAVAVLGRSLLDQGPAFTFASAGPKGLLGSAQGTSLFPYYGLAVIAVCLHLARPLRRWLLGRAGAGAARLMAGTLVGTGVVLSALLLIALLHPMR